ncbi:MAG: hypothetical protein K2H30_04460, partial [Clostridia bacterium]|nr:hypothetical protein [Clostridia bacterium]
SHAYMLDFADPVNLRGVLKLFALEFFGLDENSADGKRLLGGSLADCRIYPDEDKKIAADGIAEILDESAMKPVERDKKLFIICGFEQASALLQNKLLKTLEEPNEGVYFLLGVTNLAPVLDTVKSRVKKLTIPPFSEEEIFAALQRAGENPLNADAAKSCGGILGAAQNMVRGGWFKEVVSAAREICTTAKVQDIGAVAIKHGDTKYKTELLTQMGIIFHTALVNKLNSGGDEVSKLWSTPALIYAQESLSKAFADVKFNAFFQGLLYDFMLRLTEENNKWLKLRQ